MVVAQIPNLVYYKTGRKIREVRKAKGITVKELSALVGVSESTVYNWEQGDNMPTLYMFVRLLQILGANYDELIHAE